MGNLDMYRNKVNVNTVYLENGYGKIDSNEWATHIETIGTDGEHDSPGYHPYARARWFGA